MNYLENIYRYMHAKYIYTMKIDLYTFFERFQRIVIKYLIIRNWFKHSLFRISTSRDFNLNFPF